VNPTVWQAGKRTIGGREKHYRSRWEANYARYLEALRVRGKLLAWEHEPETFWFEGIKRGVVSYLPDFRITKADGTVEYREVKGWMDKRSKTKLKRMAKYHPSVIVRVIQKKQYDLIEKRRGHLIQGWEMKEPVKRARKPKA
jgi:hypothetical protein